MSVFSDVSLIISESLLRLRLRPEWTRQDWRRSGSRHADLHLGGDTRHSLRSALNGARPHSDDILKAPRPRGQASCGLRLKPVHARRVAPQGAQQRRAASAKMAPPWGSALRLPEGPFGSGCTKNCFVALAWRLNCRPAALQTTGPIEQLSVDCVFHHGYSTSAVQPLSPRQANPGNLPTNTVVKVWTVKNLKIERLITERASITCSRSNFWPISKIAWFFEKASFKVVDSRPARSAGRVWRSCLKTRESCCVYCEGSICSFKV